MSVMSTGVLETSELRMVMLISFGFVSLNVTSVINKSMLAVAFAAASA